VRTREVLARQWGLADLGVAVLVPASAAMFGLVLADALPVGANPPTSSSARLIFLFVALVLLGVAVFYRRWVYHGNGTLFSLVFLDETMPDFHEQAQTHAARHHMAVRLIGRRIDVLGRERDDVVDVVQPCQELARALEHAINHDREDTGYAVAPNVLWPAALAIGASLTRTDKMRFLEYNRNTRVVFRLRNKAAERVAIRAKPNHVVATPTGERRGVLLAFTPSVEKFDIDRRCAEFGISDLTRIELPAHIRGRQLSGSEMSRLADDLAGHLADIKRITTGRELVIVAFVPKTVSLLIGWHLSRQQVRFFADTSLMHHVLPEDRFVALRVHPSQPTTFPAPRRET